MHGPQEQHLVGQPPSLPSQALGYSPTWQLNLHNARARAHADLSFSSSHFTKDQVFDCLSNDVEVGSHGLIFLYSAKARLAFESRISVMKRKPSVGSAEQWSYKLTCASVQYDRRYQYLIYRRPWHHESLILIAKTLTNLRICAGWSEPLLAPRH